jgi:regulator of nucleoside diphosphate kinase
VNAQRELPPITLTTSDYNSLLFTAVLARRLGDPNAEFLISELTRASVCHPDHLPEDVVSTLSRDLSHRCGAEQPCSPASAS